MLPALPLGLRLGDGSSRRGLLCFGCRRGRNITQVAGGLTVVDRMWTSGRVDVFTMVYVDELCVRP